MRAAGRLVDHHLGVAVVGGDQRDAALGQRRGDDPGGAGVGRLAGGDGRFQHAGVADHVGVGEVDDHEVEAPRLDRADHRVGDAGGAHLRLQVVGRHLRRGDQGALLAGEGLLAPAVEEEGDVRVLLGLGGVELGAAVLRDDGGDRLGDVLRREGDLHPRREFVVVLDHRDVMQARGPGGAGEAVERGVEQSAGQLARAVVAEVEVDHRVAVADRRGRPAVRAGDDGREDELVGDARGVGGLDRGARRWRRVADALHDGGVGLVDALPALVAVHRVVAAGDGGDRARAELGDVRLQVAHEAARAVGRGVAPVGEGVDEDARQAAVACELQEGAQVVVAGVDAAVAQEAEEVERLAALPGVLDRADERGVLEEGAVLDRLVEAGDPLVDDEAGAEVEVPDLGVAHLPGGQADVAAGGSHLGVGELPHPAVDVRRVGQPDGVAGVVLQPAFNPE